MLRNAALIRHTVGIEENLWTRNIGDAIPRALYYVDNDKSIAVFGLESREM
jgi:hypothetical protein